MRERWERYCSHLGLSESLVGQIGLDHLLLYWFPTLLELIQPKDKARSVQTKISLGLTCTLVNEKDWDISVGVVGLSGTTGPVGTSDDYAIQFNIHMKSEVVKRRTDTPSISTTA